MPETATQGINKKEIGERIKRLRKEAGLRQWQLAEIIGATQPAIHMYERGVLPEPKRLLELARIGDTTVEWILTGRHWENGSEEMHRVPQEIYRLAFKLKEYSEEDREALESALEVIQSAVNTLKRSGGEELPRLPLEEIARHLRTFSEGTISALAAATRIHDAVSRTIMAQAYERLGRSELSGPPDPESSASEDLPDAGAREGRRRRPVRTRSSSLEAVRGHIYKLDGSLLVIGDILKDKDLRAEFEETLGRLGSKLETKKRSRAGKMKRAQKGK